MGGLTGGSRGASAPRYPYRNPQCPYPQTPTYRSPPPHIPTCARSTFHVPCSMFLRRSERFTETSHTRYLQRSTVPPSTPRTKVVSRIHMPTRHPLTHHTRQTLARDARTHTHTHTQTHTLNTHTHVDARHDGSHGGACESVLLDDIMADYGRPETRPDLT